ncbi:MAG: hypothetical protein NVSMB51_19710 [Solirubrobacteraceae bacterium]
MAEIDSRTLAGSGSFRCETCGHVLPLADPHALPACPRCGADTWARAPLFSAEATPPAEIEVQAGDWLSETRAHLGEAGHYIAYEDAGRKIVASLEGESTRIGRSMSANVRFDDPTVSRRHALILRSAETVRLLDDRSLNGVFVNGERVEDRELQDGDEIVIGRYRLHYLVVTLAAAQATRA